MAHIGTIRVLEQAGIKPDYISGTSMGAVIGALYAMGYSADQIEEILSKIDWDALITNDIPRNRLSYLDRSSEERYLITLSYSQGKFSLPNAFNQGYNMLKYLERITLGAHDVHDFSKFQIPFLCVATDLETGEEHIFDKGDIVDALRASVAFPSIFSPYEIDGRVYVDGGVRNNLPVVALKELGIDIIIASDVQDGLRSKSELNSVIDVLEQVGSFQNATYNIEQLKLVDILIKPNVKEYGLTDYKYSDTIIERGERAARTKWVELRALESSSNSISADPLALHDTLRISAINIEGNTKTTEQFIAGKLKLKKPGNYSISNLELGLDRLTGSQFFDKVEYRFIPTSDSTNTISIRVKEKSENVQIRTGIHFDDDYDFGLLINGTWRNLGLQNSKLSADFVLGGNPRGSLSYTYERGFIPALGFRTSAFMFDSKVYDNRQVIGNYTYGMYNVDLFLHSTFANNYTLGFGVKLENVNISKSSISQEKLEPSKRNYLIYYVFLDFDSFNKNYKPTRGFRLIGQAKSISRQLSNDKFLEPSGVIHLRYDQAIPITSKWQLQSTIYSAMTIGPDPDYGYSIFIGGMGENYPQHIFPFVGYNYMELIGRNAIVGRLDLSFQPYTNHYLTASGNIGKLETNYSSLFESSNILLDGYALTYGYFSPIGPIELSVIKSTNHSDILTYVRVGFWF